MADTGTGPLGQHLGQGSRHGQCFLHLGVPRGPGEGQPDPPANPQARSERHERPRSRPGNDTGDRAAQRPPGAAGVAATAGLPEVEGRGPARVWGRRVALRGIPRPVGRAQRGVRRPEGAHRAAAERTGQPERLRPAPHPARKLDLDNATFRRHFPEIVQELRDKALPGEPVSGGPTRFQQLQKQHTQLKRNHDRLTAELNAAQAVIQRLALENETLRAQAAGATVVPLCDRQRLLEDTTRHTLDS